MTFTFRVAPEAERQIRSAARWWAFNRRKAPGLLREELAAAIALIEELPYAGEAVPHPRIPGLRRLLLAATQYHVYYAVAPEEHAVEVLALWHTSRGSKPRL